MNIVEEHKCHGGTLKVIKHHSTTLNCEMTFSIFLPPQAQQQNVPVLTFLSGLTCTHENFTTKANAYGFAAQYGIAVVAPDTSPRGAGIPKDDAYDFGQGAGFYINATKAPWADNFHMEDYIKELNSLITDHFPVQPEKQGITGHSMGGHGALTLGLKYPELFHSISAFAPIVAPSKVPWGQKAFTGYLGNNESEWLKHDACELMTAANDRSQHPAILIDQGGSDNFLHEQLKPELFQAACEQVNQALELTIHDGYDHSYYFIQSFIANHIAHHAKLLCE